jgi:hypothetical protein
MSLGKTVTIPASVALFGLGWMWVGFWPTLVLTVIGPALIEEWTDPS